MHATRALAPELVSPAQTLRHAALYLGWAGWQQEDLYYSEANPTDPTPPADAVGAIAVAVYGHPVTTPHCDDLARFVIDAENLLRNHLHTQGLVVYPPTDAISPRSEDDLQDLYDWNDAPWQTRQDVIKTLNAAADDYDRAPERAA